MANWRNSISYPALISGAGLALIAAPAQAVEIAGVGWEGQGADLVVLQLDTNNAQPDMILVAYDNPSGPNTFRYKVGKNLGANGQTANWSGTIQVPGLGWEGQGAGAATADLDGNGRPELILMAYDNPAGANNFRYTIGWNLNANGIATGGSGLPAWTNHAQVAGVGWEGQGAAVVIGQIDSNPRPDMIFVAYDNPAGANSFRYRVGFNVNAQGNATWSATSVQIPGLGWEGQGAGAAIAQLDSNPRPDLVLLAYDNPAQANNFRYTTGLNLSATGVATPWTPGPQQAGVGWEGQGAGLAITCLDSDPRADWIVMAYDNPAQANSFRYNVLLNHSQAPCPGVLSAAAPPRKSINELTPQEVASLRRGYTQMIAWNSAPHGSANYRRSLQYWANMHAYFGANCAPVSGLNTQGMTGVTAQAMSNADEQATWCKCAHNSVQFLTWHRMYLYYFEQVLRAASGDPNLRLPYWDYSLNPQLPAAYRDATWVNGSNQTVPNPLRVANRQAQLNGGSSLAGSVTSAASAMSQSTYNNFNNILENAPHGAIHCAVGVAGCPTGMMGAVPAAGLDPIFYSHHANIDRLYECWLKQNPAQRLPTNAGQLNTQFSFIDGSGALVTRTVSTMLTTAQLAYSYTAGGGCPAGTESAPLEAAPRPTQSFDVSGPARLKRGVTRVPVRVEQGAAESFPVPGPGSGRTLLIIEGLAFDVPPRVSYNVYLEGPGGRRALVGVISFFGRTPGEHAGHEGSDRVVLDATDALRTLGASPADTPALIIEPETGIEQHSAQEAARRIDRRANVRFRRVILEVQR